MKLSCITTIYNEGALLQESLTSLLAQTYEDFEIIVVNDGASEASRQALEEFSDPRIRVIRQANDGLSSARNRAIEHVKGDYVCFLDADDQRPDWTFRTIVNQIEQHQPDLILCTGLYVGHRGRAQPFFDQRYFDQLALIVPSDVVSREDEQWNEAMFYSLLTEPQSANKFIRTGLLNDSSIRFPNGQVFEDIFFHSSIIAASNKIAYQHNPGFLYYHRYQHQQLTGQGQETRFDLLATVKMTLEAFALSPGFQDPKQRTALVLAAMRIIRWSNDITAHSLKYAFRQAATGLFQLIDPKYLELVPHPLSEDDDIRNLTTFTKSLMNSNATGADKDHSITPPNLNGIPHEQPRKASLLHRLWPGARS